LGLLLSLSVSGALGACIPPGESGQCSSDEDCTGRGTVCELTTSECIPISKDYSTTAEPSPPMSFSDKAIPFFRGRICSAPNQEVQTGSPVPVTFQPCLHPCISTNSYQYHNQYFCTGGSCDAFSVFWAVGSSENCPADAWGEFDPAMCSYNLSSNTNIGPIIIDGVPIDALLSYEIPYLSNLDITKIAEYMGLDTDTKLSTATDECASQCSGSDNLDGCLFGCYAKQIVYTYPRDAARTKLFNVDNTGPIPPANCTDDPAQCECYEIGF
ncbi:MAG: hypothetical protein ACPHRO_04150, partial [Nannocystaceae bacterium]